MMRRHVLVRTARRRGPLQSYPRVASPLNPSGPQQRDDATAEQLVAAPQRLWPLPASEIGEEVAGADGATLGQDLFGDALGRSGDELVLPHREAVRRPRHV